MADQTPPTAAEQAAYRHAAIRLRAAISDVSALIGESRSGARAYGDQLAGASNELGAFAGNEPALRVISRLLSETQNMLRKTEGIEKRLAAASGRVNELTAELETARREAATDGLTGLGNRREFDDRLAQAIEAARSDKQSLALVLFDLDHFKKFNDEKGHLVGDQVLRHVGRQTARALRDGDTAARYGGEEFALILPGASLEGARALAERLRVTFDLNPLVRRDTREEIGHVTISAGVALFRPEDQAEDFVGRADRALYTAKKKGRNRVITEVLLGPPA